MTITIKDLSPHAPDAVALLEASHALMRSLFPADANHMLDPEALAAPGVSFFGAEAEAAVLGCVALVRHADFAEIKSLFVAPEARGIGLGARLLEHAETVAASEGLTVVRLETGDKLMAASALYEARGYVRRGPFGNYGPSRFSVFFEKVLVRADQISSQSSARV